MIAAALSFNSGILLFADADHAPAGTRQQSRKIFHPQDGAASGCARSVFAVSDAIARTSGAFEQCERALDALTPESCTINRMRAAIEDALSRLHRQSIDPPAAEHELAALVALYSPVERRYALFHTLNTDLREVAAHDCVGPAAYLGHYLIRDRYNAARSMDALDLATVFSIATDTLEGIRACNDKCGRSSEMAVMYADGHVSHIQRMSQDTHKQREVALAGLART
jgi:hypothetical protein